MLKNVKTFFIELGKVVKHVKYTIYVLLVLRIILAIYIRIRNQND